MNDSILMEMDSARAEEKLMAQKKEKKPAPWPDPDEKPKAKPIEKNPGHTWRKLSAADLVKMLKETTDDPAVQQIADFVLLRVEQVCEEVAMRISDVPRGMDVKNDALKLVFEEIADAVELIPTSKDAAVGKACEARMDAVNLPDLSAETRRVGFEAGYKEAMSGQQSTLGDFDLDID